MKTRKRAMKPRCIITLNKAPGLADHAIELNSRISNTLSTRFSAALLLLGCLFTATSVLADQSADSNHRVNESAVYSAEQLAASLSNTQLPDPFTSRTTQNSLTASDRHSVSSYQDVWISDIGTLLYADEDRDGYFAGLSLTIDADTHYSDIDVYVAIDIQRRSGPRERLHTSSNFTLYGNIISDEYRIDIDLLRNYPIGSYDVFIDLHDASNSHILDSVGASQFSNLRALPLESEEEDQLASIPVHVPTHEPVRNDDIRVVEYAGGTSTLLLAILGMLIVMRFRCGTTAQTTGVYAAKGD